MDGWMYGWMDERMMKKMQLKFMYEFITNVLRSLQFSIEKEQSLKLALYRAAMEWSGMLAGGWPVLSLAVSPSH